MQVVISNEDEFDGTLGTITLKKDGRRFRLELHEIL